MSIHSVWRVETCTAIAILLCLLLTVIAQPAAAQTQLFVAPAARGDGTGSSAANAADYTSVRFWSRINAALDAGPVTVTFLDGEYAARDLVIQGIGHPDHRLTLQSESPGGAVFAGPAFMQLRGVQNVAVRNFRFTGSDPRRTIYKLQIRSAGAGNDNFAWPSQYILIEGNQFVDALTGYGAIGVSHGSHHITIHDNLFQNVGNGTGAHMIYSAYHPHHIKVIGNRFIDSRGDYVRFRDYSDFGEVRNNTFLSTGPEFNRVFVQIPVFNDVNPGDETHASNYLIRDNSFTFYAARPGDGQDAMGFHSSGYNPPGLEYLPTAEGGRILTSGTPEQKRQLMLDTMNIDLSKVRVFDNTLTNVRRRFVYTATPNYGAVSRGWTGTADISDAVNTTYLGAGDVYSDGVLDENDIPLFLLALQHTGEMEFLLDERVWFGDYRAADLNGDGKVDLGDVEPFLALFEGVVPDEALVPVRALLGGS